MILYVILHVILHVILYVIVYVILYHMCILALNWVTNPSFYYKIDDLKKRVGSSRVLKQSNTSLDTTWCPEMCQGSDKLRGRSRPFALSQSSRMQTQVRVSAFAENEWIIINRYFIYVSDLVGVLRFYQP
jgi:hypothetical protein